MQHPPVHDGARALHVLSWYQRSDHAVRHRALDDPVQRARMETGRSDGRHRHDVQGAGVGKMSEPVKTPEQERFERVTAKIATLDEQDQRMVQAGIAMIELALAEIGAQYG